MIWWNVLGMTWGKACCQWMSGDGAGVCHLLLGH